MARALHQAIGKGVGSYGKAHNGKRKLYHFTHMTPELMQKTMQLKRQLDDYVNDYRQWIKTSGAVKNLERFID